MSKEKQPLVSVIIPVYNGEAYLQQAIESVLKQCYTNIELIAVNDGSTDSSGDVIQNYSEDLIYINQENQGVAFARTAGLEKSSGELIAFLDQDDYWFIDKIEKQVSLFEQNPNIGLVHTAVRTYDEGLQEFVPNINRKATPEKLVGNCFEELLRENHIYNSSVMVRKSCVDEVGGINLEIKGNTCQDYDLWLKISKRWYLDYINEPLTVWRTHSNQGHRNRDKMLLQEMQVLNEHFDFSSASQKKIAKRRFSSIHYWLGEFYLENDQKSDARSQFIMSMRHRVSFRALKAFMASFLKS
uniref:glycosyltransferase family 2 protein n=1 Tax=Ningiella ruwaisensis TaxID=2364274 RepID=UPI0010A082FF|nr:glycosyltransferase [Ningiella ruwaisensis]